jgi:hypothetical protein
MSTDVMPDTALMLLWILLTHEAHVIPSILNKNIRWLETFYVQFLLFKLLSAK